MFINHVSRHRGCRSRIETGFTLFELMIVLVIMAAMMVGIGLTIKSGYARLKADETARKIEYIKRALELFRSVEGRYPCPHLPQGFMYHNEDTGRENCTTGNTVVTEHKKDFGTRPLGKSPGDDAEVLFGVLPRYVYVLKKGGGYEWKSLFEYANVSDFFVNDFKDPWGGDIFYAVSNTLTDTISPDDQGVIPIKDGAGQDTGGVSSNANYAIVFSGPNKGGANDFFALERCINYVPFDCYDQDWADGYGWKWLGIVLPGRKVSGLGNDVATADDVVFYSTDTENFHWVNDGKNIKTRDDIGAVLIKKTSPQDDSAVLDVGGTLYSESNVRGNLLCKKDGDASSCYSPESLIFASDGTSVSLKCANANEFIKGISVDSTVNPPRLKAVCEPLKFDFSGVTDQNLRKCANGKLRMIYTNGKIDCVP